MLSGLASKLLVGNNTVKVYPVLLIDLIPGNDTMVKTININALPAPIITGSTNVCTNQTGMTYSTEVNMTGYAWSISGGTIISGSATNSIIVDWGITGLGNLSVNYINGNSCTAETPTSKSITINALPVPSLIGPLTICANSVVNVYKTEKAMTNYSWSITGGIQKAGGSATDSAITIEWDQTGTRQVSVNYTNSIGCSASTQTTQDVTLKDSPMVNLGGSDTISVLPHYVLKTQNNQYCTYLWQDGSTADSLIVDTTGKYNVLVTNPITGCYNTDTVFVYVSRFDGSITKVTGPTESCEGLFNSFDIEFTNNGSEILESGENVRFSFILNGLSPVVDVVQLTEDIAPGSKLLHSFTGLSGKVIPGSNVFKIYSIINYDIDNSNDTLQYNLTLNPSPAVHIANGEDTMASYPGKVLSSKLGTGYSYQWQNGSNADSIVADTSGLYTLRVINLTTGCEKTDSVVMIIGVPDMSILPLSGNKQLCKGSSLLVELGAFNSGEVEYKAGEIFVFGYILNSTFQHIDSVILTSDIFPGDTISHQLVDFSSHLVLGANNITFFVKPHIDYESGNDSLENIFIVHPLPVISFEDGKDTLYVKAPYQLKAGPATGYTYLWQDNSTLPAYKVLGTGKYFAEIIDINGCFASDTIMIYAVNPDATISSILGESSACLGEYDTLKVGLTNEGLLAFAANDTVLYSLLVNNSLILVDTVLLADTLEPKATITHFFTDINSFLAAGTDVIKVSCTIRGDENFNNDTAIKTIVINPIPSLNLNNGVYNMTLAPPYILDAGLGPNYTYSWQDGSPTQNITVISNGTYKVVATDISNGCISSDSVLVTKTFVDISVSAVRPTAPICMNDFNTLQVDLSNKGNTDIMANDSVTVFVKINNSRVKSIKYLFTSRLQPDGISTFQMSNLPTGAFAGTNRIIIYCSKLFDTNNVNDTLAYNLTINPNPEINIEEEDTVEFSGTHILDAGIGFSSYLWNTGATTRTITVNSPAWYIITVSNAKSCISKDSVFMKIKTNIKELQENTDLLVFPNPAMTIISLKFENTKLVNPVLEIFSSEMKSVYYQTIKLENSCLNQSIRVECWKKGIYFITLYDRQLNKQITQKVVIE
jgi:hypothetical protein